ALNTVYIEDSDKWLRIDARGNVGNCDDEFSLEKDNLAFSPRAEFGEIDYNDNNPDLDERLVNKLEETENLMEMNIDFEF
ncbi:MAG: transglutaminase, partial [Methanobrevibacter sp.]|nr:transglutaminase [Methanobrevibacter sp.]